MDEKTFKLGSIVTAMIAAVIPATTAISKIWESEQQDRKFEYESQMRYIDLLVSNEGQRDWYFRRDVLSFYSEVLPKDHPVKSWAQKELKVAQQEVEELEKLKRTAGDSRACRRPAPGQGDRHAPGARRVRRTRERNGGSAHWEAA